MVRDESEVLETLKRQKPHQLIQTWWNAMAQDFGLQVCNHINPARKDHMQRAMAEGMLDHLGKIEQALRSNPYYSGQNPRNKAADLDWFLKPGKWQQVISFGSGSHKKEYTYKEALAHCQKLNITKDVPGCLFDFDQEKKTWIMKESPQQKKNVA